MGYIKHHAIIVIGGNIERANLAHREAVEIFGAENVTPVLGEVYNGYCSFFVGPDGSKEGWGESDAGDERRARFIEWLTEHRRSLWMNWAEVVVGSDDGESYVERHAWSDIDE